MSDRIIIRDDADVDTAVIAEYEQSRRDLMRRGAIAGGALVAASSVPFFLRTMNAFAQTDGDASVLNFMTGTVEVVE